MFDEKLKALLASLEWTPERLCVEMQNAGHPISVAAIYTWLRGTREPQLQQITGICAATGCSPSDLVPTSAQAAV